jgi:hypothetical protein
MIRVGWPRGLAFNLMFSSIVVGTDGSDTATQAVRVHFYDDPCFGGDQVLWFTGATTFAGWGLDPREGITNCAAPFGSANNRSSGIPSSDAPTAMAVGDLNGDGEPTGQRGSNTKTLISRLVRAR